MISDRDFFRDYGFGFEIEPVEPDLLIEATPAREFLGMNFEVLEVPGHCPGSLCFFSRANELLFGGDVLFAGGVGRWDLPGGDGELLFAGIREKLYSLGDNVTVLPGHGPVDHDRGGAAEQSLRALVLISALARQAPGRTGCQPVAAASLAAAICAQRNRPSALVVRRAPTRGSVQTAPNDGVAPRPPRNLRPYAEVT